VSLFEWLSFAIAWIAAFGGLWFGIHGMVSASRANETAGGALEESTKANALAAEANRIARAAADAAEEVQLIQQRAEAREIERHDVRWIGRWRDPATYLLTNGGSVLPPT
jgi:hypothetical protein